MTISSSKLSASIALAALASIASVAACSSDDTSETSTTSATASSSSSSSSGQGGAGGSGSSSSSGGGAGGGEVDHGAPSDVYPAFKPSVPTMVNKGGPILKNPVLHPVFFANDDASIAPQVEAMAKALGDSAYWPANTAEYGVGKVTVGASVYLPDMPTGTLSDDTISKWLAGKLNADDPAWPAPEADAIYVLVYPDAVTITDFGGTGCKDFGAYHFATKLDAAHASRDVVYATIPRCANFQGLSGIDMVTAAISHEVVEAVTDPIYDNPAYGEIDEDHLFWELALGAETGDMCSGSPTSYTKFPDLPFVVQRSWSNKEALAFHDPCAPALADVPYFNTAVVAPDLMKINFGGTNIMTHVIQIPVGQTRDVELDLFSVAKTSGPWTVAVYDIASSFYGQAPELKVKLDRKKGVNGEKIHASITHVKAAHAPYGVSTFYVSSMLGNQMSTWVGAVAN